MSSRLVVEITRSAVRVAVASGVGLRLKVQAMRSQPLALERSPSDVLRALLNDVKPAFDQVIAVIAREHAMTRVVKFPTVSAAELAPMVELYTKAQLPYPRDQAVLDVAVLRQAQGFSEVMIVACLRDAIDRQWAILREAGVAPTLMTLSSWGVLEWSRRVGRLPAASGATLIMNLDDTRTDLVVVESGRLLSSRSLGQGRADWPMADEAIALLLVEAERSQMAVRKESPWTEVGGILLAGADVPDQWREALAQRFSVPVEMAAADSLLKARALPTDFSGSAVVIAGVAGSDPRRLANLSPPQLRSQLQHRHHVRRLVSVSSLTVCVLLAGAGLLALQDVRQGQRVAQLQHLTRGMKPTAKQLQEKRRRLQVVSEVMSHRREVAGLLSNVFRQTAGGTVLEHVSYEYGRRELIVRGTAASNQAVLDYLRALKGVEGIGDVELKYATVRATPAGERTGFELVIHTNASS
ncbi:MAG: pilus assembly protein PilM [Candidatus Omnitrophica bacterium]|nr:pilus assembly protein PilM [Candidatus Omnitrophota bacterium]